MEIEDDTSGMAIKILKDVVGDFEIIRSYTRPDGSDVYKFASVYINRISTDQFIIGFNSKKEFIQFMSMVLETAEILMEDK